MSFVSNVMNTSSGDVSFLAVIFSNAESFSLLLGADSDVRFFGDFSSVNEAKTKAVAWFKRFEIPVTSWK